MAAGSDNGDREYFISYEDLDVHELMLKDQPRTKAYQQFIENNKSLFLNKIVVDVGAGTGILSLLAAKVGAKQVYAIEASGVSQLCQEIVSHNGLDDKVTVLHGRAEDVTLPDGVKADVLISEWMGFYLLHESMLNSVISARDRFLHTDGIMVPSTAMLYLCPVSMKTFYDDKFRYWNNVYGFDFTPILRHVKSKCVASPQIETLDKDQCLADSEEVLNLDLKYVDTDDLCKIISHVKFTLTKNGLLHGLACWFDVGFGEGADVTVLSTGPDADPTHWKQTVILLPDPLLVNKGDDLQCTFSLEQSVEHPRRYNISIEVPEEDDDESEEDAAEGEDATADLIVTAMQNT